MQAIKSKPQIKRDEILEKVKNAVGDIDRTKFPMIIIGVGGYYKCQNDISIYDDAIFIDSPNIFESYNANVDPTIERLNMVSLKPGLYYAHRFGLHKGRYLALIQSGDKVTIKRYQNNNEFKEDTGYFDININKGSFNHTQSDGCQTIYPEQYSDFINCAQKEAIEIFTKENYDKVIIPYVLLDF